MYRLVRPSGRNATRCLTACHLLRSLTTIFSAFMVVFHAPLPLMATVSRPCSPYQPLQRLIHPTTMKMQRPFRLHLIVFGQTLRLIGKKKKLDLTGNASHCSIRLCKMIAESRRAALAADSVNLNVEVVRFASAIKRLTTFCKSRIFHTLSVRMKHMRMVWQFLKELVCSPSSPLPRITARAGQR